MSTTFQQENAPTLRLKQPWKKLDVISKLKRLYWRKIAVRKLMEQKIFQILFNFQWNVESIERKQYNGDLLPFHNIKVQNWYFFFLYIAFNSYKKSIMEKCLVNHNYFIRRILKKNDFIFGKLKIISTKSTFNDAKLLSYEWVKHQLIKILHNPTLKFQVINLILNKSQNAIS